MTTKEQIECLIDDLKKSIDTRKRTSKSFFSEELVIIRLREILKGVGNDN